jgi:hypothetical protein
VIPPFLKAALGSNLLGDRYERAQSARRGHPLLHFLLTTDRNHRDCRSIKTRESAAAEFVD